MSIPVHHCSYAGQPDISIQCGGWSTPFWGLAPPRPPEGTHWGEPIVKGEDPILYTFEEEQVTFPQCLELMAKEKPT